MLTRLVDAYCRLLQLAMVVCLALMVLLVFGNVFLRYAFNTGITVSDELSRWLFVWMTFMGAVVALRDKAHLGTDFVVNKLPLRGRKLALGVGQVAMLFICWLLFSGAWAQMQINRDTTSAAMEASMAFFYASGVLFAVSGGLLLLMDLWRLLSGRLHDNALTGARGSEEAEHKATP